MCLKQIPLVVQVDGVLASAAASSSGDGSGGKPASSEGIGIAASGGAGAAGGGSSASARDKGSSSGGTAQAVGECLSHAAFRTFLRHRGAGSMVPVDSGLVKTALKLPRRTPGNTRSHPHAV